MRLFVAIVPPDPALAELRAVVDGLAASDTVRWTPDAQWHLTLAFLGDVADPSELEIRLARAAARHRRFELRIAGGGRFGDRVLWAGIAGDREPLRRLAGSVQAGARRAGIRLEDRAYRPHVTLARSKAGTDLRPLVEELRGFTGTTWTADTVHLVRSRLGAGPGGTALHETLRSWTL